MKFDEKYGSLHSFMGVASGIEMPLTVKFG